MPSHSLNGFNDRPVGHPFYEFGQLDPTKFIKYFEDFFYYASANWTITKTELGAGNAAIALDDVAGGVLKILNDDADNDNVFLDKVGECFKWDATKDMFFGARFKLSDATQSDLVIGLQITDTTPLAVTDGLFFSKADGATTLVMNVGKNSTFSTSNVGTLADNTWVEVAFVYSSAKRVFDCYWNGARVGSAQLANTNAVDDEELTISIGLQNGEAAAKSLSVDYVFAAMAR